MKWNVPSSPFVFGPDADYWPGMEDWQALKFDMAKVTAGKKQAADAHARVHEQREVIYQHVEQTLGQKLLLERRETAKMIEASKPSFAASMAAAYGKRKGKGRKGKTKFKDSLDQYTHETPSMAGDMARPGSARRDAKKTSRFELVRAPTALDGAEDGGDYPILGAPGPSPGRTARAPRAGRHEEDDDLGTSRDDLDYDEEDSDGSASDPGPALPAQVFHETTNNYHVRTIRKWETDGFRMMKKLVLQYMDEGRAELKRKTEYWQEMYDEQTEDLFEVHEKLAELEEQLEQYRDSPGLLVASPSAAAADGRCKRSNSVISTEAFHAGQSHIQELIRRSSAQSPEVRSKGTLLGKQALRRGASQSVAGSAAGALSPMLKNLHAIEEGSRREITNTDPSSASSRSTPSRKASDSSDTGRSHGPKRKKGGAKRRNKDDSGSSGDESSSWERARREKAD